MLYRLLLASCLFLCTWTSFQPVEAAPMKTVTQADQAFQNKNYRDALNAYREARKQGAEDDARLRLQIVQCLEQLKAYDELLSELDIALKQLPPGLWRARFQHYAGQVYQRIPHLGFWRNGQLYRNEGVREGERRYVYGEDRAQAKVLLGAARTSYEQQLKIAKGSRDALYRELILLNGDLISWLESDFYLSSDSKQWPKLQAPKQLGMTLDAQTEPLQQRYFLYRENVMLAEALKDKDGVMTHTYRWVQWLLGRLGAQAEHYPDQDPLQLLTALVERYPNRPLVPELELVRADMLIARGQHATGEELLQRMVKRHAGHAMVVNAKARLQDLRWPALGVNSPGVQSSGQAPTIQLSGRNVPQVELAVYQLPNYVQRLTDPVYLNNPELNFQDYAGHFGKTPAQLRAARGPEVARWSWKPSQPAFVQFQQQLEIPKTLAPGAYVLEATGPEVEASTLLLVSDLLITTVRSQDQVLYYLTDAQAGKPVAGAQLYVKERWYGREEQKSTWKTLTTNAQGVGIYATQSPNADYSYEEALAIKGDQVILSRAEHWSRYHQQDTQYRIYTYSDRPVYRPEQTVNLRHLVRLYRQGSYENVPAQKVVLYIHNPRGEEVLKQTATTDAFGAVSVAFEPPANAPLGVYRASVEVVGHDEGQRLSAGQNFRIEEYKKPEFSVQVTGPKTPIKPGEATQVTLAAQYLFGSPVTEAKIQYRIYRRPFYPAYQGRPHPYAWLYPDTQELYRETGQGLGTLVSEGEVELKGRASISIPLPTVAESYDQEYGIVAEVTDASRRMEKGEGRVRVTHQGYYAFLDFNRGFYSPGERAEVEINLSDADGRPVAAQAGTLEVVAAPVKEGGPAGKVLRTDAITSDAQGRAFLRWENLPEGRWLVRFHGRDAYERKVTTEREVWVLGSGFQGAHYRFQGVEILTDQRIYRPGEKARILVTTKTPDSHVLWLEEAGQSLLRWDVLTLRGRSQVLQIPITAQHAPNFQVRAIQVAERQVLQDAQELFVPPTDRFLQVQVKAPKSEFQPGESTTLEIQAQDAAGKPLQAAFSLGVADAAIYQIQADISGDIRSFFYGDRRGHSTDLSSSQDVYFASLNATARQRQPYKPVPLRGGLGRAYGQLETEQESADMSVMTEAMPMPAPQAPASLAKPAARNKVANEAPLDDQGGGGAEPEIRSDFRDTALWQPLVITDAQGRAQVPLTFPDSLTTWKVNARGISAATQVGSATAELVTTKNLLVRLQAPRFFTEGDTVTLSANLSNRTAQPETARVELKLPPGLFGSLTTPVQSVTVPASGQARVDWSVRVHTAGAAVLQVVARGQHEADAMQLTLPVQVYGSAKTVTRHGTLPSAGTGTETLFLPAERRPEQTQLEVRLQPSLAGTVLEALPYLAEFPYGCIEQTTSRFVPAVITAHTLRSLGLSLKDLGTQQNLAPGQQATRITTPVQDEAQLKAMIQEGLQRIRDGQNSDGGWGWWTGGESSPYMTAYVLYALQLAQGADLSVDADLMARGLQFLWPQFKADKSLASRAFTGLVLARAGKITAADLEPVYALRNELSHYGRALLALSYQALKQPKQAQILVQNLMQYAVTDTQAGTVSWPAETQGWWYWYNDRVETHAFILQALMAVEPKHGAIPGIVRWLVDNRQGNRWYSTKDTAHVIYALNAYLRTSGELKGEGGVTVRLNGQTVFSQTFTPKTLLTFPNRLVLPDSALRSGNNRLEIERTGTGPLYYTARLAHFTQERQITAAGNGVAVKRQYFRIHQGQRVPISTQEVLPSGTEVEVELRVTANNDYEYLMLEDPKPAGMEPLERKSGYVYQNGVGLYRELRDNRTVFFLSQMPQGTQVLTYRLRAEIPGEFAALPHRIEAMYAPRIQAISEGARLKISDQ